MRQDYGYEGVQEKESLILHDHWGPCQEGSSPQRDVKMRGLNLR